MLVPRKLISTLYLTLPVVSQAMEATGLGARKAHCIRVLHEVLASESNWAGIHAAEELVRANSGATVRTRLEGESEPRLPRIGRWRVLAVTADDDACRVTWLERIETVVANSSAPDRKQAIETLAKLRRPGSPQTLRRLRRLAETQDIAQAILPLWCLHWTGEPASLRRLSDALESFEPLARQRAGYALRWIGVTDPAIIQRLVTAAEREAPGLPRVFLVSAVLHRAPDNPMAAAWRRELWDILLEGPFPARFEAAQALRGHVNVAALETIEPLLRAPDSETRIAAAGLILDTIARHL